MLRALGASLMLIGMTMVLVGFAVIGLTTISLHVYPIPYDMNIAVDSAGLMSVLGFLVGMIGKIMYDIAAETNDPA